MIQEVTGDIFKDGDINCIAHQANCFCRMGSGVAAQIKKLYPAAYEADCKTRAGDVSKMGKFTHAPVIINGRDGAIFNLYGQYRYGTEKRHTSYDSLHDSLRLLDDFLVNKDWTLGLPYNIGCGLGGGSWRIVKSIIYCIFEDSYTKVKIIGPPRENSLEEIFDEAFDKLGFLGTG